MNRTLRTLIAPLACALVLSTLAAATPRPAWTDALTPLRQRSSDEVVSRDLGRMVALGNRLDASGSGDLWRRVRARELLAAARIEYMDNDRTGFDAAAYAEALALGEQIADHAPSVTRDNVPAGVILPGSTRVREDLWSALESLKKGDGFDCAVEPLAQAEVQLLWAGNEQVDQGDCRTSPHVAAAERLLDEARVKAAACLPPPVALLKPEPAPEVLKPAEPVQPVAAAPTPEELRIPRNVHFALDKYFLSDRSRSVIAGVVAVMKQYPGISVRLEGHTDSRASVAYNLRLSRNRVEAVRRHMAALGIPAARLTTTYKGKSELKVREDSKANFARNRRVEMVFVDSEGHDIQAEEQEEDLQLEGSRRAPHPAAHRAARPIARHGRHAR